METKPLIALHPERALARKLIIQIPCYNEEESLPSTLAALPRTLPGIGRIEWLVVDDGSTDGTCRVARRCGADYVLEQPKHGGLALAFTAGVRAALRAGADVIVNTDADNQYCADDIGRLIRPVLDGEADLVVGARPIDQTDHFSPVKKRLQHLGSWLVRLLSGTDVPDAPSGFRALSREAALRINVFSDYTYTLETLIQAGRAGLRVRSVPIKTNGPTRPSRLMRSTASYVLRSLGTLLVIAMVYRPLAFFFGVGLLPVAAALVVLLASPTTAGLLFLLGAATWLFGLLAELTAVNRKILEELQLKNRRDELAPRNRR